VLGCGKWPTKLSKNPRFWKKGLRRRKNRCNKRRRRGVKNEAQKLGYKKRPTRTKNTIGLSNQSTGKERGGENPIHTSEWYEGENSDLLIIFMVCIGLRERFMETSEILKVVEGKGAWGNVTEEGKREVDQKPW